MPTPARSALRAGVFSELQAAIDARLARSATADLIPLHIGDTYLTPPACAVNAARDAAREAGDAIYRYGATAGLTPLRNAIAERLRRRAVPVETATQVHVAAGATHALFCGARAVLDPGDEVLVAAPYWPGSIGIFMGCGAVPVEVPITTPLEGGVASPAEALAAHLTPRTRAVYFSSPNNPDGKVFTRADLEEIACLARQHDLWVLSDEVYADIAFDRPHVSIASLPGMFGRTLTVGSLSKSHALAGARVGYLAAGEELVELSRRVSTHTVFNVPVLFQRAALAALDGGDAWIDDARATYLRTRDVVARALSAIGVDAPLPEGGTYFFLDLRRQLGGAPLLPLLERAVDEGVLLTPGSAFGAAYERFARLCFTAAAEARTLEGVARLGRALARR